MLTEQTSDFFNEHQLHGVATWYNKLTDFPVLAELNNQLHEIIVQNSLSERLQTPHHHQH